MSFTRRGFVNASCLVTGALAVGIRPGMAQQAGAGVGIGHDRIVLLGTKGGPVLFGYAPSPSSNLLVHKGVGYIIDAGYGTSFKLVETGFPLSAIRYVFITHHHSDHNLDLGPLLYNAWVGGLRTPIDAYGPAGMNALVAGYWDSNRFDIETRIADEGRPDPRKLVTAREYAEGVVLENADVKVMALRNMHPPISESYAIRFEFGDRTVVFSGDTAYFPPLAEFARGADFLIHEVMYGAALEVLMRRNPNAASLMAHLKASHTLAEDVGRIASAADVKTLVLNHFVPADKSVTPDMWASAVRTTFGGNVVVGRDLLELAL